MLKIRVHEHHQARSLGKTLKRYKGTAWDQSPLFKKRLRGGVRAVRRRAPRLPWSGDYYFDHSPPDVEMLGEMAKIAAAAHAPFIAAAQPTADADGFVAGAEPTRAT